eukprot:Gb_21898 [translate_table: standard]
MPDKDYMAKPSFFRTLGYSSMATPDYSFLIRRRLARKVVGEVMNRVRSPKTFSVAKVFIGLEEHVTALKECGMERQIVIFVRIIGMGGIGKSTHAKAIFDDTRSNFSRASYIEDVKCHVEKYGLKHIHQILLGQLLCYDFEVSNSSQGEHMLKMKLIGADALIVYLHSDRPFIPFKSLVYQFVNVCKGLPLAFEICGGRVIVDEENPKYQDDASTSSGLAT